MSPAKLTTRHALVRAVSAALRDRCHIKPGDAVLLAVSGGADSVALLRAMHTIANSRRWRLTLHVAHVQHHLRQDAEQDAAFVAELAAALELPFHRADLDPSRWRGNTETSARQGRYAALDRIAQATHCRYVAVAHHGDDQWETILLRLLRGAGVAALSGMAWRRLLTPDGPVRLIRPMLALERAAVLDTLAAIDQPYRHDHTNDDVSRRRARLRRDVMPVLRELSPKLTQRAIDLTDHLSDMDLVFRSQVGVLMEQLTHALDPGFIMLITTDWPALPRLLRLGILRAAATHCGVPPDRASRRVIQQIDNAILKNQRRNLEFHLSGGVKVNLKRDQITLIKVP